MYKKFFLLHEKYSLDFNLFKYVNYTPLFSDFSKYFYDFTCIF